MEKDYDSLKVIASMADIVACLEHSDDIRNFLQDVHRILSGVTYADNFYVVIVDSNRECVSFPYFRDTKDAFSSEELDAVPMAQLKQTLTYYAIQQTKVLNLREPEIAELMADGQVKVLGTMPLQWICFPLEHNDNYLGAFIIQSYRDTEEYTGVILDVLTSISHVIASALSAFQSSRMLQRMNAELEEYKRLLEQKVDERTQELESTVASLQQAMAESKRLQQQLEHETFHDPLTGLQNRKFLYAQLELLAAKIARHRQQVHLAYLDLDGFKPINDTYGHESGDKVLKVIAERLEQNFRSYDVISRIGGDEFVVVFGDSIDLTQLRAILERTVDMLAEPIELRSGAVNCGVSIGVASSDQPMTIKNNLISRADKALYAAKNQGKGRVVFYQDIQREHDVNPA